MALQTFGECLRAWMRDRGCTNARLAQLTHEKSGTTISRLLHDQCTAQRCAAYLDTLLACVPDITPEEAAAFRRSVDVTRFGKPQYRANQVFLRLMTDAQGIAPAVGTVCDEALLRLLLPWTGDGPCEVLCFGCFDARVLGTLGALLRQVQSPLTITHYFVEELHADLIFLLEHTLLMLGDARYQLISFRSGSDLRPSGVAMQDALLLRNAEGGTRLILPVSGGSPLVKDFPPDSDLFGFYRQALKADEARQHRYSSDFGQGSAVDFVAFLTSCLHYESNRSVFHLKPDLGTEYMPVGIVRDNFQTWVAAHPEYASVSDHLVALYTRRHQNLYEKKRPHMLVMSKDAMVSFARTGRTADHPFCLRPFTPEERADILDDLIRQAERSAHFIPLVLRDPAAMPQHQLIAYDDLGLLICDARTDYSLDGYSEVFLRSPLVAAQFKTFLLDAVCRDMAESPTESLNFLRSLSDRVKAENPDCHIP